jgi:hypothetical protein
MTLRKGAEKFGLIPNITGNGGIIQRTPRVPASEKLSKCVEIKCLTRVHNNILKNPQITYIITDETAITSHPFNTDTYAYRRFQTLAYKTTLQPHLNTLSLCALYRFVLPPIYPSARTPPATDYSM